MSAKIGPGMKRSTADTKTVYENSRALTPLFGNGAGAFRVGKNSVVLTKIGKNTKFYALNFLFSD